MAAIIAEQSVRALEIVKEEEIAANRLSLSDPTRTDGTRIGFPKRTG